MNAEPSFSTISQGTRIFCRVCIIFAFCRVSVFLSGHVADAFIETFLLFVPELFSWLLYSVRLKIRPPAADRSNSKHDRKARHEESYRQGKRFPFFSQTLLFGLNTAIVDQHWTKAFQLAEFLNFGVMCVYFF